MCRHALSLRDRKKHYKP